MSFSPPILACATCLSDPNAPAAMAANFAIIFMLGILVVVMGSLCSLIIYLKKKATGEPFEVHLENPADHQNSV